MARNLIPIPALAVALAPGAVLAHPGPHDGGGLAQGLAHALGSADHLIALVALALVLAPAAALALQRRAARRAGRRRARR